MLIGAYTKESAEVLDYDIDFSSWLPDLDYLVSAVASLEVPADSALEVGDVTIDTTRTIVKVWLSAGTSGKTYQVRVLATSHGGRVKEAEIRIKVQNV